MIMNNNDNKQEISMNEVTSVDDYDVNVRVISESNLELLEKKINDWISHLTAGTELVSIVLGNVGQVRQLTVLITTRSPKER
jgi:hypothetical protein